MPTRWVHIRLDEKIYDRARAAADADRRSLSNWIAVACERVLDSGSGPQNTQLGESEDSR